MRDVPPARADHSRERYEAFHAAHRWRIPDTFNFGIDVVDAWARETDGPALIWQNSEGHNRTFSYADMATATDRAGALLRRLGVGKGDRVLVMLPRLPEWMIALVGAMKIGAVPIPCIEMLTARDLDYRIANSGASAVICRAEHAAKFAGVESLLSVRLALGGAPGWRSWDDEFEATSPMLEPARVNAEDPAIMYYTSGSTGHPKGVVFSARGIYAWRNSATYWLDLRPGERIWCTADTGWSKAGTSILFGPWSCGACSFFYDGPFVPAERVRLLREHAISVYCAPGTELARVVDEPQVGDLPSLRRVVTAGEAMNPIVSERWEKASGVRIDEAYGQTETLMIVLNYPAEPVRYGSMGRPAPGCDVDVVDTSGNRLSAGREGDLALMSPNPQLMLGYWGEPTRTAACYREGADGLWFLTGDRAEKDADGYIWFRGRSDDVINSAGYRIGPLEVENALLEHAAVLSCAVVGSPDVERGEVVKAFVVLRHGVPRTEGLAQDLQRHVKQVTAPYKYPRRIEFVDALPMTLTGKIRRRDLKDRELAAAEEAKRRERRP